MKDFGKRLPWSISQNGEMAIENHGNSQLKSILLDKKQNKGEILQSIKE